MINIFLKTLFQNEVCFNNQKYTSNPKMLPFIIYKNSNFYIFDLVKTIKQLELARLFLKEKVKKGKSFLIVGTKPMYSKNIYLIALKYNLFYINFCWLGGILTNWNKVKSQIKTFKQLELDEKSGIFSSLTKKEISFIRKKILKLKILFDGIKNMRKIPDVLIVIDSKFETKAIFEAKKLKIPIVALVDIDADPTLIDFPIACNTNSKNSVLKILELLFYSLNIDSENLSF